MKNIENTVQEAGVQTKVVPINTQNLIGAYFEAEEYLINGWLDALSADNRLHRLFEMDEGEVAEFASSFVSKQLSNIGNPKEKETAGKEMLFCFQQNGQTMKMVTVSARSEKEAVRKVSSGQHLDTQTKTDWFEGFRPYSITKEVDGQMVEYRHTKNGMRRI